MHVCVNLGCECALVEVEVVQVSALNGVLQGVDGLLGVLHIEIMAMCIRTESCGDQVQRSREELFLMSLRWSGASRLDMKKLKTQVVASKKCLT